MSTRHPKAYVPPPEYDDVALTHYGERPVRDRGRGLLFSKFGRKPWGRRVWIGLAACGLLLIIIIIAAVVGTRHKNRYPNYSGLKYKLAETYQGEGFFDKFNYFTGYDPSQGFVHYVPAAQAREMNLTFASPSAAVLRVDTSVGPWSVPDASTGRFSVRVESKSTYDRGLFIFDVRHAPLGCGAWPALWLTDASRWPHHGEIDVMEATNHAAGGNLVTLHTGPGCSMAGVRRKQSDVALQADCDAAVNDNTGCGVRSGPDSFGGGFNAAGGAVLALEWRDAGIRLWQFARGAEPPDLAGQAPDPSSWGIAAADFPSTDCDISSHFRNNSIVLNIDLCGPLVYGTWAESTCPSNCTDIVANQPEAFADAFWEVGSFRVFQAA
ncbi:putative glycosidase [Escovopsis weberi]|uniref:Putative glycosidase n=1 Tax=Escovopsis weberi TaxID=150374 RepID=A0A0N0RTH3_ESCWE|nr:putative glycosidase [Escovopsis weberi]